MLPDEDSETEWETAASSSVAASEVARAVRDLDLRSEKAKEESKEVEEEKAWSSWSNWSEASNSSRWSQGSGSRSNWTSDDGAWAEGWYRGNSGYHRGWRGGRW